MRETPETLPLNAARRRFLSGAAGAAAALALGISPRLLRALEPAADRFGVSIMMWTYNQFGPMPDRLERVHAMGIEAVELVRTVTAKNNEEVAAKCHDLGLKVHNIDAGTSLWGAKDSLVNPAERPNVMEKLRLAVQNARLYRTDTLLALSGTEVPGLSRDDMRRSLVDGLKAVMEIVEAEGLRMILEPLNRFDHKGFYLTRMDEAFAVVDEVGSDRLKILFDIYHVQMEEGRVIPKITANIDKIGHFHIADVPGRHQPGTGELNYDNILAAIAATSYRGFLGLEFLPHGDADSVIPDAAASVLSALDRAETAP
jgi:hydroxypyruvate isomerase